MKDPREASILTAKQRRALEILNEGPLLPEEFYLRMWPEGKYAQRDPGSSKGGPSRTQCATNWYLGRFGEFVHRDGYQDRSIYAGKWQITAAGRRALQEANA